MIYSTVYNDFDIEYSVCEQEHNMLTPCLDSKKFPKKCYSIRHIESYDTCMDH